jgi:hypothetical protein
MKGQIQDDNNANSVYTYIYLRVVKFILDLRTIHSPNGRYPGTQVFRWITGQVLKEVCLEITRTL